MSSIRGALCEHKNIVIASLKTKKDKPKIIYTKTMI